MMAAVVPDASLSHGTIECESARESRRFYEEFLGLGSVRPLPESQYLWSGGPWSLVCVEIGAPPAPQGPENRFCLAVAEPDQVTAAHEAAERDRERYKIRIVEPVRETDGARSFCLCDLNGTWWEIYARDAGHYDRLFARGDVDD